MQGGTFEYEDLKVWHKAMEYASMSIDIGSHLADERKHFRIVDQLESSSLSVAMNIAEGKGRNTPKMYIQFLHYSRGSLYESLTMIELLQRKKWIPRSNYEQIRALGFEIAKMLNALITSIRNRMN